MKKVLILSIAVIALSSCNKLTRIGDSEIDAIRDQTEVMEAHNELIKEQNKLLLIISKKK